MALHPHSPPSDIGTLESPRAKWAKIVIAESTQWGIASVSPETLLTTFQTSCGGGPASHTPVVLSLKAGHYTIPNMVTLHRSAPYVLKAEDDGVTFEMDDAVIDNNDLVEGSTAPVVTGAMIQILGSGDLVMQGITFTSNREGYSCLHAGGSGRVCIAECKFSCTAAAADSTSSSSELPPLVSCVAISSSVGCFYSTQCEYTSGSCGVIVLDDVVGNTTSNSGRTLQHQHPLSVVLEDAGFGAPLAAATSGDTTAAPPLLPLLSGILLRCHRRVVHLLVDHSAFDNTSGAVLTTFSSSDVSSSSHRHHSITFQHSTITNCGIASGHAVLLKGHDEFDVQDCTFEHSGSILLGHASTCRLVECSVVWDQHIVAAMSPRKSLTHNFHRCLVAQDQSNLVAEKCEWSFVFHPVAAASSSASSWTSAFMTLLSTGRVEITGNLFQQNVRPPTATNADDVGECQALLTSILVSGSSAPTIHSNRFDTASSASPSQRNAHHTNNVTIAGILLGLWHDAKISDNSFSESMDASTTFMSTEDRPQSIAISEKLDDAVMEPWVPRKVAVVEPIGDVAATQEVKSSETTTKLHPRAATSMKTLKSNRSGGSAPRSADQQQQPRPPPPRSTSAKKKKAHRRLGAAAAEHHPAAPADALACESVAHNEGSLAEEVASEAATIAVLRDQVAALKQQLQDATTRATMTNSVSGPAPTSARTSRPSTAPHSARPTSARRTNDPSTSPRLAAAHHTDAESEEKIVRVGHHEWNMSRMKAFMQGRVPLAEVRRDAPLDDKQRHLSPRRANSPTAIYDAWKRNQEEKREEEERLIRKRNEDENHHRRKLTAQQQSEMVHRIHTESIEHQREARAVWATEALEKLQRPRFATMKRADAIAEAEGDFEERLSKDLRDRKARREQLLKKYLPEQVTNVRPKSEIEAYASSMHRGHHDAQLIAKLNDDTGLQLRVMPPRSSYKERPSSAKKVRLEDQMTYCASLYTSHRDGQLAEKAARIIGDDCVVRVGARSSSRGPAHV